MRTILDRFLLSNRFASAKNQTLSLSHPLGSNLHLREIVSRINLEKVLLLLNVRLFLILKACFSSFSSYNVSYYNWICCIDDETLRKRLHKLIKETRKFSLSTNFFFLQTKHYSLFLFFYFTVTVESLFFSCFYPAKRWESSFAREYRSR